MLACRAMAEQTSFNITLIGAGCPHDLNKSDAFWSDADIVWIFPPDDEVNSACLRAIEQNLIKKSSVVLHSSGALDRQVPKAAEKLGTITETAHPLCSIAAPNLKADLFQGVPIGTELDEHEIKTKAILHHLFEALGEHLIPISSTHKPLYHAAAVLASNFLPCLYDVAKHGFEQSGLTPNQANTSILGLMQTMLNNLKNLDETDTIKNALTGPLARGDRRVITQHINALDQMPHDILRLYQTLSLQSLHLTSHPDDLKNQLIQLLTHPATDSGK